MNRWFRSLWRISVLGAICVSMLACGSGGGGGGTDPSPNSDSPPISKVFVGDHIDPNKWRFLHFVRKIENGRRVSEIARRGVDGENGGFFVAPPDGQLNSLRVDVTVFETRAEGTQLQAWVQGRFYRDSTGLTTGTTGSGRIGEIIAQIDIRQKEGSSNLIAGTFVERCLDNECENPETLFNDSTSLGSVTAGRAHKLSVDYDQTARTFTFGIDGKTLIYNNAPVFAANSEKPEVTYGTSVNGADPDADPSEEGFIAATIDNLIIDGVLFTDYENPNNNLTSSTVRRVTKGQAELERTRLGKSSNSFLSLTVAKSTPVDSSLTAKVSSIEGLTVNGATAQVLLDNDWYHTGSNVAGFAGEVSSDIRIGVDGVTRILAFKCDNSDCSSSTQLIGDEQKKGIFGTVSTSVPHTLSLSWDGTNFIYGLDDKIEMFDPTEKAPMSNSTITDPLSRIGVFLYDLDDDNDQARINVKIDEVFVNGTLYDDFSPLVDLPREFTNPDDIKDTEVDLSGPGGNIGSGRSSFPHSRSIIVEEKSGKI